jgi:DNA-binding CsgD family transcriptional regulator
MARLRGGDLADASADAQSALHAAERHGLQAFRLLAAATEIEVLIERGELGSAAELADRLGPVAQDPDALMMQPLRGARARLSMAAGDPAAALAELGGCAPRELLLGAETVVPVAWRSESAMACLALGRLAEAQRLAEAELAAARRFGAPRAVGLALRACGLVNLGGSRARGIELLQEAASAFESSFDRLERARTSVELGSALRRAGHRSESRARLTEGLEIARSCGATALVERGYEGLAAGGTRPRKILRSGVAELTASERRVAAMASEGMTNREIAEALVVTTKTVESHLGHAYRKLEIRSRRELARALASAPRPARVEVSPPPAASDA